jgi:hypothetical protein
LTIKIANCKFRTSGKIKWRGNIEKLKDEFNTPLFAVTSARGRSTLPAMTEMSDGNALAFQCNHKNSTTNHKTAMVTLLIPENI